MATARDRVGARSDRRRTLVDAAVELLLTRTLDEVDAVAVAERAGVSKALVYYYFPTNRDLQAAVVQLAADAVLDSIRSTDSAATEADQLRAGLDATIAIIEINPSAYTALARGAGYHPVLLEVFEQARDSVADVLAERMGIGELTPAQRVAVRSWIALVEEAVLHWLEADRPVPRAALVTYCQDVALHILRTDLARG